MAKTVLFHSGGWSKELGTCGTIVEKECPNMFKSASHWIGASQTGNLSNQINLHPHHQSTSVALNSSEVRAFWKRLNTLEVGDTIGLVVVPPDHSVESVRVSIEPHKEYLRGYNNNHGLHGFPIDLGIANIVTFDLVEQLYTGTFDSTTRSWTYPCLPNGERVIEANIDLKGSDGVSGVNRWNRNPAPTTHPHDTGAYNWLVYGLKIKTLPTPAQGVLTDLKTYIDLTATVRAYDSPANSI